MKKIILTILGLWLSTAALIGQFKKVVGTIPDTKPSPLNIDVEELKSLYKGADFSKTTAQSSNFSAINGAALDFSKFSVIQYNDENLPIAIKGKLSDKARQGKDLITQSYAYLNAVKTQIKVQNPESEFVMTRIDTDEFGSKHIRFDQQYNGVKIYGSELLLHTNRDKIDYLNGRWKKSLEKFEVNPSISEATALALLSESEKFMPLKDVMGILGDRDPKSELVIYYHDKKPTLTYHITAYPDNLHRWEYFIDAHNGTLINKYVNSCKLHNHGSFGEIVDAKPETPTIIEDKVENSTILNGHIAMQGTDLLGVSRTINSLDFNGVRYLIDVNRPMFVTSSALPNDPDGTIWTIDAKNTSPQKDDFNYDHVKTTETTWKSPAAVSAQYNGAKAYDYFINVHGRNSINGGGGNIISLINVADEDGKSMGNAFWNGAAMFYGNGDGGFRELARGLDVAGHEMTHGVVQNTANLEYEGESGALNESFADVFGALIDRDDWLIGEDVVKTNAFPSGALRDLSDPHNKAAANDYGAGFQPKNVSEQYKGSQDNGGVHINSGIPNYAFFLFASNAAVGKDRAEKVYYRALSQYLTKSSQFVDAKFAVMKAAQDLYGASVAAIAETAFNNVGIQGGTGGGGGTPDPGSQYQTDIKVNPGADLILVSNGDQTDIYMIDPDVNLIFSPNLSINDPLSKPSVTDDGTEIVYIASDGKLHNITVDYQTKKAQEQVLLETIKFRNVVISRDGRRLALLREELTPEVTIIDLGIGKSTVNTFKNATTAAGISTGDVQYADAMEFDYTGEYLMYDAYNVINSPVAGEISYWDINFMKVWEIDKNNFTTGNEILFDKLFSGLPEGVDVGNPTFAKNSPYIVAFDYIEDDINYVLGANIETGDVDVIAQNNTLGYPTYSKNDDVVVYDTKTLSDGRNLKFAILKDSKIASEDEEGNDYIEDAKWAVWFSNGQRVLTGVEDELKALELSLTPNPTEDQLWLSLNLKEANDLTLQIHDTAGKLIKTFKNRGSFGDNSINLNVQDLSSGLYTLRISIGEKAYAKQFVKK